MPSAVESLRAGIRDFKTLYYTSGALARDLLFNRLV
jgi:hypothetical protein